MFPDESAVIGTALGPAPVQPASGCSMKPQMLALNCVCAQSDSSTPWTTACQAPRSMRFSRQECGCPFWAVRPGLGLAQHSAFEVEIRKRSFCFLPSWSPGRLQMGRLFASSFSLSHHLLLPKWWQKPHFCGRDLWLLWCPWQRRDLEGEGQGRGPLGVGGVPSRQRGGRRAGEGRLSEGRFIVFVCGFQKP